MHECGIADYRDGMARGFRILHFDKAMDGADGSAHAQGRVHGTERSGGPERVTADIAQAGDLVLFQGIEEPAVRTSGAHGRRTRRDRVIQGFSFIQFFAQAFRDHILGEFPAHGKKVLSADLKSQLAAVILEDRIHLFRDDKLFHFRREIADQLFRKRIGHTELQDGDTVPEHFLYILIAGRGSDDADIRSAHLHTVDRSALSPLSEFFRALLDDGMAFFGVARHHDIFGDILFIGDLLRDSALAGFHDRLGVGYSRAHADDHWSVELFGQFECDLYKCKRLCRVRGLQHGNLGGDGVVAGILLVLGGMHAGIIRDRDDKTAVHSCVGHGIERVRGDVEADVLHAAESAASCQTGSEGGFQGNLLIRGPFAVDFIIFDGFFRYLRTGSPGVAGDEAAAGLIEAPGESLIAKHQFFHVIQGPFSKIFGSRVASPKKYQRQAFAVEIFICL